MAMHSVIVHLNQTICDASFLPQLGREKIRLLVHQYLYMALCGAIYKTGKVYLLANDQDG